MPVVSLLATRTLMRPRRPALMRALVGVLVMVPMASVVAVPRTVWAQEADGPMQIQAVRATERIAVDGRLDEPAWRAAAPVGGFRQVDPEEGEPARLTTEVRVLFDEVNVYVGAFMRDPQGASAVRVPNLRRDFDLALHDGFGVVLDPVGDGRFAMVFATNPHGTQLDMQVSDGREIDLEWNALWQVRTARTDSGWTAEMAIPWKTLRYPVAFGGPAAGSAAAGATWRVNFFRQARRLNELSGWSPWPRAYSAYDTGYAGTLAGLEPPPAPRNVRIQPYAIARAERAVTPARDGVPRAIEQDVRPEVGGDAKWVIDPSTVLDLTVNTDFAEVDVDRQVVNLSRFGVRFPEQRQFFLESRDLFTTVSGPTVQPFFTRRIGLDAAGSPIPIQAGARFTRRAPGYSGGLLVMRQGAGPGADASTFAVGRAQRNVGRRSRLGALVATRWDDTDGAGSRNTVLATDAVLRFSPALRLNLMLSGSLTGRSSDGDGMAATAWLGHTTNRGYFGWLQHYIGRGYDPAAGFVYARDVVLTSPAFNLDLRPSWRPAAVRSFRPGASLYLYHLASDMEFREGYVHIAPLDVELNSGGFVRPVVRPEWQHLEMPFSPVPGITVAPGDYRFVRWGVAAGNDPSAPLNVAASLRTGGYFDGTLDELSASAVAAPTPHAAFSVGYSLNRLRDVGADDAARTTHLLTPGVRLALNPRAQVFAFYQYNTAVEQGAGNVRFSWELAPLSFLHVVYNDRAGIDLETGRISSALPSQRQWIVKFSYLWQM